MLALATMPSAVIAQEKQELTREQLQSEIMRFVLRYQASMTQAFDDQIAAEQNVALRTKLQETKLANLIGVTNIVLQPYPEVNLLDLIVLLSLTRMVWEQYWMPDVFGQKKGEAFGKVIRTFESDAWKIANDYLAAAERAELKKLIAAWRKKYPDVVYVEGIRFGDFAKEFADSALARRGKGSFLFATVSEATAEMTQMRLLGERYLFLTQTLPFTVRETLRLATYDILGEPDVRRLLEYSKDATTQFKRFNSIMDSMPEEIREEIAIQAKELFASFQNSEEQLGDLLTRTEMSIVQGQALIQESQKLASSIDGTVDKLTPYLRDAAESDQLFANLTTTLNLATVTIRETEKLLASMESFLNQPQQTTNHRSVLGSIDVTVTRVEKLVDHLFLLIVAIIIITCITVVAGALTYRFASLRMRSNSPRNEKGIPENTELG